LLVICLVFGQIAPLFAGWLPTATAATNPADANFVLNASSITNCAGQNECFAFTIDTRLTSTGATTGTSTTFLVPISGTHGSVANTSPYDWIINWGDGISTTEKGPGSNTGGISHTYSNAGQYQITIRPNGTATTGWLNAFGAYTGNTSGANALDNLYKFRSINTPLTDLMASKNSTNRFYKTFYGWRNAIGIPTQLFAKITTTGDTDLSGMFSLTFYYFAYNATDVSIPAGLFNTINTASGTNFEDMFYKTFSLVGYKSTVGTIPAGLFSTINTSNGTNLNSLFDSTFDSYANDSTVGTVPANLFSTITVKTGATTQRMYSSPFYRYAQRQALFSVGGSIVVTQSFGTGNQELYRVKNGTGGTPMDEPAVAAGDVVYPTYDNTTRSITKPTGTYANYVWYYTDGTSCSASNPTKDCGAQTTPVTFPDTTQWIATTSTEKGNVTFYGAPPPPTITDVVTSAGAGVTADYTVKSNGERPNATIGTASTTRTVTITGTDFVSVSAVTVGGTACASYTVNSSTKITCTLATTVKSGNQVVIVTTPSGSSTSTATAGTNAITYVAAPTVSGVSAATAKTNGQLPDTLSGTSWTSVSSTANTITGTNLNGAGFATTTNSVKVTMGGSTCSISSASSITATAITCSMPSWGSAGQKAVQVANAYGASGTATNVTAIAAPTISSISPNSNLSVAGGTEITLTGTGFDSTFTTTVGGTNCTSKTYSSATSSKCVAPAKSVGSTQAVVTRTPYGTSTAVNVTYQFTPTVTAVSPDKGVTNYTGAVITITGTNFTDVNSVTVGGEACAQYNVVNNTTITCTLPSFVTAGTKSVLVTTAGGTNSANTLYTAVEKYLTLSAPATVSIGALPDTFSSGLSTATVSTNSPSGYNLSLQSSSANLTETMTPTAVIPTISGYTSASPASASVVSGLIGTQAFWGYRVTGQGSFGASTAAETNAPATAYAWATIPTTITLVRSGNQTDNLTANIPQNTDVWFGVSPAMSNTSGSYTVSITYTAEVE
jgi:hypothetical protein